MMTNRIALLFSALVLVASCTIEKNSLAPEKAIKEITITATVEGDGAATKTELSELDGSVLWTPGDAISLFYGSGTAGGSRFTSTATERTAVTNFTGTIGVITGGADVAPEDTYFWGLYPYSPTASCNGTSVTMTLPAEQEAMAGSFAPGTSPSIGKSQGLSMGFFNIGGGVKFTVTKPGIKRVTLRSNNGELIAGTARVVIGDSGLPSVQEILSGTDAITLEAPEGEYLEVGQFYYMIMFPTVFTGGFTLTLETFTETTTVEKNSRISIGRSYFGRMLNVDGSAEYALKTGNIPIPDANFKAYLVENFDTDSDGEISYAEAQEVYTIEVYTDNISSVRGIEYCENLHYLNCSGTTKSSSWSYSTGWTIGNGILTDLDVSNNTALTFLNCRFNQLTSLDVSSNTELTGLYCNNNQLMSLDVTTNTALTDLDCEFNHLMSLDVSSNTALKALLCSYNQLTSLNVSNNTELTTLWCSFNQLTSLDVSNNTELTGLLCDNNQLMSLNVSNNTELTDLWCNDNQLTSLDVSSNTALKALLCGSNQLTNLDVSRNTQLTSLSCGNNQLTSLDVSTSTALTSLICHDNQLLCLDVASNTSLTRLSCGGNQLTALDVSNNTALIGLGCGRNQLTSLDVSNNTALTDLSCYSNQLTSLDVSNNTALTRLECEDNQLTSLDVSSNPALVTLFSWPMVDNLGNNLLEALYIANGQSIPNVTSDRSTPYIPAETQIVVKPAGGGSEGFGEGDI